MLEVLVGLGIIILLIWAFGGAILGVSGAFDDLSGWANLIIGLPWILLLLYLIGWVAWALGDAVLNEVLNAG